MKTPTEEELKLIASDFYLECAKNRKYDDRNYLSAYRKGVVMLTEFGTLLIHQLNPPISGEVRNIETFKAIEISHDPSEQGFYESGYEACKKDIIQSGLPNTGAKEVKYPEKSFSPNHASENADVYASYCKGYNTCIEDIKKLNNPK